MNGTVRWLLVGFPILTILACSDNGELFGSRTAGGAGGAGGGTGGTAGASGGIGGKTAGGTAGTTSGDGGAGASQTAGIGGGPDTGGRAGAGSGAAAAASGMRATGGSGGAQAGAGGMKGGSGGAHAGTGGMKGGSGGASAGSSAESGAGGAAGGPPTCPTDCKASSLATACPSGQTMWECGPSFDHQELVAAGCADLGTDLPRYCCPTESYAGCATVGACAQETTQASCDARADCHSVFVDPRTCGCAAIGCCARFSGCANGGQANCSDSNVSCDAMTPYCESPAYVVSYTANCYEGCVKPDDCAP